MGIFYQTFVYYYSILCFHLLKVLFGYCLAHLLLLFVTFERNKWPVIECVCSGLVMGQQARSPYVSSYFYCSIIGKYNKIIIRFDYKCLFLGIGRVRVPSAYNTIWLLLLIESLSKTVVGCPQIDKGFFCSQI